MLKSKLEKIISSLRSIDDLIFILDAEGVFKEYFQSSNDERLYLKPKKFLDQHHSKVLPRHISKRLDSAIDKIKYHGSVQDFDYLIVKNGQEMWFEARISGIYARNELIGFVGIVRDITKRKFAEQRSKEHCDELEELKKFLLEREMEIVKLREQNDKLKRNLKSVI